VSSIAVASDFAEQLQQVAEFADTVPEGLDGSEALCRSVFSLLPPLWNASGSLLVGHHEPHDGNQF
jgi:hypothetical protein